MFKLHTRFAQRRDSLEDCEHIGRLRTVRTELKFQELAMLMRSNCSQMQDEVTAAALLQLQVLKSEYG